MRASDLRLCTMNCAVPHYENCDTCFGFGVNEAKHCGETVPVSAFRAEEIREGKRVKSSVTSCPECGSTVFGIPTVGTK